MNQPLPAAPPSGQPAWPTASQATAGPAPAPLSRPRAVVPVHDPRGDQAAAAAVQHGPRQQSQATAVAPAPATAPASGRPAIERLLVGLVDVEGSDLHLAHDEVPRYRVDGGLHPIAGEPPLVDGQIETMLREIITPGKWEEFARTGDLDTAYQMDTREGAAMTVRFRINVFRSLGHLGAVFRVIPTRIRTLDELRIKPQVKQLAQQERGLVLVVGPTGSGKSSTLAGLVDEINTTRAVRIFTLEDPVEFRHSSKKSLVNHREVGTDTPTWAEGLRRVRREDPDVILIGEMRDTETMQAVVEAASTGHLVLATMHTNNAAETVSTIINSFPGERQDQIRTTLAQVIKAVVAQTLVPAIGGGRVAATEILIANSGIANSIRNNDIPAIRDALVDTTHGSLSREAHLAELVSGKAITKRDALRVASTPESLERFLGHDPTRRH